MDPPASATPSIRNFAQAIDRQRQALERIPLIEARRHDLVAVAQALDEAEAAALAIAAGEDVERFAEAARTVTVPVLRADPIAEEYRIYESRICGADAVLLPWTLPGEVLARLVQAAASTHMAACVACESPEEIVRAIAARAPVLVIRPALLPVQVPRRTLLLARSFEAALRGQVDAALDPSLTDAAALRAALEQES